MAHNRNNHPSQKRYPPELRERAVRMVLETIEQTGERFGVITRVAPARRGDRVAQVLGAAGRGRRPPPGVSSQERQRIAEPERDNREPRRANELLEAVASFFARELCATRRKTIEGGERPSPPGRRSGRVKPGGSPTRGTPGRVARRDPRGDWCRRPGRHRLHPGRRRRAHPVSLHHARLPAPARGGGQAPAGPHPHLPGGRPPCRPTLKEDGDRP
jgi:transposase